MLQKLKDLIIRIWKTGFFKFAGSSAICWSTDQLLAALLAEVILPLFGVTEIALRANISGYTARVISAGMNFLINRRLVFNKTEKIGATALRYTLLAVVIITLSNQGVIALVGLGLPRWIAKIMCDFVLYFVNFAGQRFFVFRAHRTA